jgi:hypothetical protein
MRVNRLTAGLCALACALLPLALIEQRRVKVERDTKRSLLEAEADDMIAAADAMLVLIRQAAEVGQRLATRAQSQKLDRLREMALLCRRMAMPERAVEYGRGAQEQVKFVLAKIGSR